MTIRLLVGLGNPGTKYHDTRHNAGFWLLERFAQQEGLGFKTERDFSGRVARSKELWLLMPQTYMNLSGQSVAALANFYRIAPDEILVAHDELDLAPGTAKLKKGGGHAGHNGLRDILRALGGAEFWRLRIGIGHPRNRNLEEDVTAYVLHAPRKDEMALIEDSIGRALNCLPDVLAGSMETAMMKLHTKP